MLEILMVLLLFGMQENHNNYVKINNKYLDVLKAHDSDITKL